MRRTDIIAIVLLAALVLAGCTQGQKAAEQKARCFAGESLVETELKLFTADTGMDAPFQSVVDKTHVVCPSGGKCSFDPKTGFVNCSVHGHK